MAAKKTSSTIKTLQARPKVAAKTTTAKSTEAPKAPRKVAARKTAAKPAAVEKTDAEQIRPKKTSLDVLRLFIKTYEDL